MDSVTDDEELFSSMERINEKVPFHKVLGIKVKSISFDRVQLSLKMRDEFVGNFIHGTLHGGVISAIIDVTGGYAAYCAARTGPISGPAPAMAAK
jgi:acyl-coenzyme A thioesterase PaaI-like protein